MAVIYLDRPVQEGDPLGSVYDPTRTQDFTNNNSIPFLANSVGTNTQTNQISNTGGEFDFFNNLNFGTDFTKQNLGGYGTFSGEYLDPTVTSPINTTPVLEGIQTAAPIDMIPAPITPFINQGSNKDDNGGIKTIKTPIDAPINLVDEAALTTAKKDTNIKNLINMGLVKQAKDYVKNNYGYMIMNTLFFGSGHVAKTFVENKKKKEAADAAAKELEEFNKSRELQALEAAKELEKEKAANQAFQNAMAQGRGFYDQFGKGDAGSSASREEAGPGYSGSGTAAEMGSFKKGGRIGYGTGGIVTL